MTWMHTPMGLEDERHVGDFEAECERYDGTDEYWDDAWDWLTSQAGPPDWLLDQLDQHYPWTTHYVDAVARRIEDQ